MTRPNNVTTNYTYDNLSRLLSVLHQVGGSTIDGATYTVDNAGNRTAKTDWLANVTSNYGYDQIYELLSATQGGTTTESYTYDAVGNRLSSLGLSPYQYNVSNELTQTPNTIYAQDANGNTTLKTDSSGSTTYTWDYENRLTSVTLPGTGGVVTFKYDPLGHRIQKSFTQPGNPPTMTVTNYVYDEENTVAEVDASGNVVAKYAQTENIDEPLAESRAGTISYYEVDGLGSVTSLSNGSGTIAQTYTFDSFGKQTASSGSLTNPFRYTAREFDPETNLYYYRARYYDASSGRFVSEDPMGIEAGINLHVYAFSDPGNLTDPLGLQPDGPWWSPWWWIGHLSWPPSLLPQAPVKSGIPAPSPVLDDFLRCLQNCIGAPILVTSTTDPPHQDPGHALGTSVDIRPPATATAHDVFCCAGECGAAWGLDEGPGGGSYKFTNGYNYHFQLFPPHRPSPKAPNAIPPNCKPGFRCPFKH